MKQIQFTTDDDKIVKVLVLFDGHGCISNAARRLGLNVVASDILPLPNIDVPVDVMNFKPQLLGSFVPDIIWASPPCETWSIKTAMKGGGNRYWETIKNDKNKVVDIKPRTDFDCDKRLKGFEESINLKRITHTQFIDKTFEIIKYYQRKNNKLVWFVENPYTGFLKFYIRKNYAGTIENITTYNNYGAPYRKETVLFSNVKLNLKWSPVKSKNNPNPNYSDCFSYRWDHKKQKKGTVIPQTYLERSMIPEELCNTVMTLGKEIVESY